MNFAPTNFAPTNFAHAAFKWFVFGLFALPLTLVRGECLAAPPVESPGAFISSIGSERATSGFGGKIATFAGKTHVVWQDAASNGYLNRVRSLDHESGQWSQPFTLNKGKDNHARPVITVDEEGYLHVILSGHNSPVTYRRSLRPGDGTAWTEEEQAGSGTYPVLVCGPGGTLYLTLRSSNRWNGIDLYVKPRGEPWRMQGKLILRDPKLPGYAGFASGLAWGPEHRTLHLVVDFYESKSTYVDRGIHQAVCSMRSRDGGQTWQKADGSPVDLPARPEQMDILARDVGKRHEKLATPVLLAQGCLVVDSADTPHVLYISHLDKPGEIILAAPDAQGQWQRRSVDAVARDYPDLRPVGCRGGLSMDASDTIYGLLELVPLGEGWKDGKPTRGMKFLTENTRLVWLISQDGGETFATQPALPAGTSFNENNLERPTGFNVLPAGQFPPFLYFDGTSRYRKKGELLQNNVYFVRAG